MDRTIAVATVTKNYVTASELLMHRFTPLASPIPQETILRGMAVGYSKISLAKPLRSFLLNSDASVGRAVLEEMSRASGSTLYVPNTENEPELTGICMQIAYELREQYSLGFYSSDLDGKKWRQLKVRINKLESRPSLTLSYREGYQLVGN